MTKVKHFVFEFYIVIAVVCLAFVLALLNRSRFDPQASAVSVGSALSFVYFVQKQKLEELNLFHRLFSSFNERYDGLNEQLRVILDTSAAVPLTEQEEDVLTDYFNLCAEEYFFHKHELIYPEVWRVWRNGMQVYFANSRIRQLWKDEEKTDSYYGFKP